LKNFSQMSKPGIGETESDRIGIIGSDWIVSKNLRIRKIYLKLITNYDLL
jgi:hypothetical protein